MTLEIRLARPSSGTNGFRQSRGVPELKNRSCQANLAQKNRFDRERVFDRFFDNGSVEFLSPGSKPLQNQSR